MSGEEWDVTSKRWRRLLASMSRAGVASAAKRSLRKKVRRTAGPDIKEQRDPAAELHPAEVELMCCECQDDD